MPMYWEDVWFKVIIFTAIICLWGWYNKDNKKK